MKTWRDWNRGHLLLGVFLVLSTIFIWVDETHVPDLAGHWASKGCESVTNPGGAQTRLTRDYLMGDDTWRANVIFYDDQDCAEKSFGFSVEGHYDLGAKALGVTGATQGRFGMERLKLVAYNETMAGVFTQGQCGNGAWVIDEEQDVSRFGCLQGVPSVFDCPAEYDVVSVRGDELLFGDRSYSLCLPGVYPKKLGSSSLIKQE